jgi:hypothetical protein
VGDAHRFKEVFPMPDLAFYNAGCEGSSGLRQLLVLPRRLLRRLLRPIFQQQVALFQHLIDRLDRSETEDRKLEGELATLTKRQSEIDDRVETVLAFGWDYVAMVRRLALIEDQLAALGGHTAAPSEESDARPSILFPGFEPSSEPRSKVC